MALDRLKIATISRAEGGQLHAHDDAAPPALLDRGERYRDRRLRAIGAGRARP